ncbi:hypothetical protein M426DRAFT_100271 [Hypoxylon sp. CI-4A]|nr:hypothetical protein M426DRAFT_100271 [Hypoxylon sp. CI-4A]
MELIYSHLPPSTFQPFFLFLYTTTTAVGCNGEQIDRFINSVQIRDSYSEHSLLTNMQFSSSLHSMEHQIYLSSHIDRISVYLKAVTALGIIAPVVIKATSQHPQAFSRRIRIR